MRVYINAKLYPVIGMGQKEMKYSGRISKAHKEKNPEAEITHILIYMQIKVKEIVKKCISIAKC